MSIYDLDGNPVIVPPTQRFVGAIECGHGTPWDRLKLTDLTGSITGATYLGPVDRGVDGEFYSWSWCDTRIRFVLPPRLLPWSMRRARTMLIGRTVRGEYVGPFTVEPFCHECGGTGTVKRRSSVRAGVPGPAVVMPCRCSAGQR